MPLPPPATPLLKERDLGRDDNVVAVGGDDTGCTILEVAKDAFGKTHAVIVSADVNIPHLGSV